MTATCRYRKLDLTGDDNDPILSLSLAVFVECIPPVSQVLNIFARFLPQSTCTKQTSKETHTPPPYLKPFLQITESQQYLTFKQILECA